MNANAMVNKVPTGSDTILAPFVLIHYEKRAYSALGQNLHFRYWWQLLGNYESFTLHFFF